MLAARDLTYGMITSSADEASRVLDGRIPEPEAEYVRGAQAAMRNGKDWHALALWSRVRLRWLARTGNVEVRS